MVRAGFRVFTYSNVANGAWEAHVVRVSRDVRNAMLDQINTDVYHLTTKYQRDGGSWLPGLLWSLDNHPVLTANAPKRHPDERVPPRQKPGPRPPINIDWPSGAREIRDDAIEWDQIIRGSYYKQRWQLAFRSITMNAGTLPDDDLKLLGVTAAKWVRAAELLLGYVDAELDMPVAYSRPCLDCGQSKIVGVALAVSAWCHGCGTEYNYARIRLLLRQSA